MSNNSEDSLLLEHVSDEDSEYIGTQQDSEDDTTVGSIKLERESKSDRVSSGIAPVTIMHLPLYHLSSQPKCMHIKARVINIGAHRYGNTRVSINPCVPCPHLKQYSKLERLNLQLQVRAQKKGRLPNNCTFCTKLTRWARELMGIEQLCSVHYGTQPAAKMCMISIVRRSYNWKEEYEGQRSWCPYCRWQSVRFRVWCHMSLVSMTIMWKYFTTFALLHVS
jgi:hypothetical protein